MALARNVVIKHIEADFQVNESYLIDDSLPTNSHQHLLLLRKCGYSTFNAIHILAEELGVTHHQISYYGLKDEDAMTQQLISVNIEKDKLLPGIAKINDFYTGKRHYLSLTYMRESPYALKVGGLVSNNFLLTVRKLPHRVIKSIERGNTIHLYFLNYYGPQRFSIPNEAPSTHLIGKTILSEEFNTALAILKKQASRLGQQAKEYTGTPSDFFANIDCREKNFFINSFYSSLWNNELKSQLIQNNMKLFLYTDNTIPYLFADNRDLRRSAVSESITQKKAIAEDAKSTIIETERPSMLQVFFKVISIDQDDYFDGYYKTRLQFSLPSGAYATMAIAQFLHQLEAQYE